ncbi:MAG TPA: hypothetical protein VGI39_02245, partial [Polyangiaceae bacterium]
AACGGGTGTNLADLAAQSPFVDGGPDSSSDASISGAGGATVQDPFATAPAYAQQTGPTTHNPGLSCMSAACHASSGGTNGAPDFFLGGTVYTDYAGKTPAPGIEIRVTDAQGHATSVYSSPQGTFYVSAASGQGFAFPVVVGARDGTTVRPMVTPLGNGLTSCGLQGCHVSGGGPPSGTGNYYPIHLP